MNKKSEAVAVRSTRLFQSFLTKTGPMLLRSATTNLSQDALIDSFLALFDECSKDALKKDVSVKFFVNKFNHHVNELRALRVNLSDFNLKSVIGKGQFGVVHVVEEKTTGDTFALKIINKAKTLKNTSSALFEEERDILSSVTSEWLTSLQYAFQDDRNLYLVMEFLPGGDLASLLDREGGKLTVEQARFYLAETLLAIHDLHRMGYVHRDVKPDNVLLDRLGHVKLGDFGSAARLFDNRVVTAMPAGTPDYIAPEVLQSLETNKPSYGIECDFWSLGVMAFTLVVGTSPFAGHRPSITYSKIIDHEKSVTYPEKTSVTDSLKDLVNCLLKPADKRLDYYAARKHVFFLETDFSTLRQAMPPIVPVVSSPDDISNFTKHERKPSEIEANGISKDFSGKQLPFIGYTFSGKIGETKKCADDLKNQQKSLEVLRKENKELLSKLLAAQKTVKTDGSNQLLERERASLQRELSHEKQVTLYLRKSIQDEREDRRKTEEKVLQLAQQNKQAQEKELKLLTTEWQTKIDLLNDRLTQAHTTNNELTSRCDRAEAEVVALRVQVDKYQESEKTYRESINKAREFKRRSVTDFESRLDRIQTQEDQWQKKLNVETAAKQNALLDLQQLQAKFNEAEKQWTNDRRDFDRKLRETLAKLETTEKQLNAAQMRLDDTSKLDAANKRLADREGETLKLRAKINTLETELSNANCSFLELETKGQQDQLRELEKELRAAVEEKDFLKNKIQSMVDRENEVKIKLGELEKISKSLELEVGKLEDENLQLKKIARCDKQPTKPSDESEIQNQQKIIILEQQISKLEGQVERLRESAVLEKQELRTTQSKLFKTERELSNAKIDVRIAQREAKTFDEQIGKLTEEVKISREKLKKSQEEKQAELSAAASKIEELSSQLKNMECEIDELKKYRSEASSLSDSQKKLERDYNGLRQELLTSEKQLAAVKAQVESLQSTIQVLSNEKTQLSSTVAELRTKIGSLELNNTVLRETSKMQDEQLEDYEKFVAHQTAQIQALSQENVNLKQKLSRVEADLNSLRLSLNEEKNRRAEFENVVAGLRAELMAKTEVVDELRLQLEYANNSGDSLAARLNEKDRILRELENEVCMRDNGVEQLQREMLWLKEELSAKLSDIYLLKEDNSRLCMELEESNNFSDALNERIHELEHVIEELDAYHKQREIKDEATKQQQNKLISFLQAKIQEDKKKRNFADKLFGARRRDPPSPQTPLHTSPRPSQPKSTSGPLRKKIDVKPVNSPRTEQAIKQLVASPNNQLARMHHKIPHRFKIQSSTSTTNCVACHSVVARGTKASVCIHCSSVAHPNCASTAPKTCGLPSAYTEHYVRAQNTKQEVTTDADAIDQPQGWVDLMMPGETSWKRRYVKIDENNLTVYETEPKRSDGAICKWSLSDLDGGSTIVSDHATSADLPNVAKNDLPFVIKIVQIPATTCWPEKTTFLLVRNSSDKTKWITALQNAIGDNSTPPDVLVSPKLTLLFTDTSQLAVKCVCDVSDNVKLFGTERGLYSFHAKNNSTPVKIDGVTSVHKILFAPQLNLALLIAGEGRRLVATNYRSIISNANAAACAQPGITTELLELLGDDDSVTDIALSGKNELAVATTKNLHILRWGELSSRFEALRSLRLAQPVTCLLFHRNLVIIGCQTFQAVSLLDFSVNELMMERRNVSQSLLRMGSSPMSAMQISPCEILLCFRELGVFVNEAGVKTRPDLKWTHVPTDFAFSPPLLYVICKQTVEIIHLALVPDGGNDDSLSIATTATLTDSGFAAVPNASLLGVTKNGGIYLESEGNIYLLPKNPTDDHLKRVGSVGQFSFTSSLMSSLDGDDSESEKTPPPVKHTQL